MLYFCPQSDVSLVSQGVDLEKNAPGLAVAELADPASMSWGFQCWGYPGEEIINVVLLSPVSQGV